MGEVRASERIEGVRHVQLRAFPDERGRFLETFRQSWFPGADVMVQGNRSDSRAGVLRGMHFHLGQADYWYVPKGQIFVALFDLRSSSATRETLETFTMGEQEERGVYIPPGVAHGFAATRDATLNYFVDRYYDGGNDEHGVAWNDPQMGIPWPVTEPELSDRDRENPKLADIPEEKLPK